MNQDLKIRFPQYLEICIKQNNKESNAFISHFFNLNQSSEEALTLHNVQAKQQQKPLGSVFS